MSCKQDHYWIVSTLNDIEAFLSTNGMYEGAIAVAQAAAVFREVGSQPAPVASSRPRSTAPVVNGSFIRFGVYSHKRK
jgi:hypothetical protein